MPSQQRLGSHDRCDPVEQPPSDFLCPRCQPPTLVIGKTHSAVANLLSQNPILLDQIMDDMLLVLVHPAGQGDDEKGNRVQERA